MWNANKDYATSEMISATNIIPREPPTGRISQPQTQTSAIDKRQLNFCRPDAKIQNEIYKSSSSLETPDTQSLESVADNQNCYDPGITRIVKTALAGFA